MGDDDTVEINHAVGSVGILTFVEFQECIVG